MKKKKKNPKSFRVFVHYALKLQTISVIEKLGKK